MNVYKTNTSGSTSRTLFGKQEETLKESLCAQAMKHSSFQATSLFSFKDAFKTAITQESQLELETGSPES
jgi:hypothetical protein